jgi:hypothetical protein
METIQSTQDVVRSCSPFDETVCFFKDRLEFRIHKIYPVDDPSVIVISVYIYTEMMMTDGGWGWRWGSSLYPHLWAIKMNWLRLIIVFEKTKIFFWLFIWMLKQNKTKNDVLVLYESF